MAAETFSKAGGSRNRVRQVQESLSMVLDWQGPRERHLHLWTNGLAVEAMLGPSQSEWMDSREQLVPQYQL